MVRVIGFPRSPAFGPLRTRKISVVSVRSVKRRAKSRASAIRAHVDDQGGVLAERFERRVEIGHGELGAVPAPDRDVGDPVDPPAPEVRCKLLPARAGDHPLPECGVPVARRLWSIGGDPDAGRRLQRHVHITQRREHLKQDAV
jgi:hypothetical protein